MCFTKYFSSTTNVLFVVGTFVFFAFVTSCDSGSSSERNYLRDVTFSPGGSGTSQTKGALQVRLDKPCGTCLDYAELVLDGFGSRYLVRNGSSYRYENLNPGTYTLMGYGHEYVTYATNYGYGGYGYGGGFSVSFGDVDYYDIAPYDYYSFYPSISTGVDIYSSSRQLTIHADSTTFVTFKF